MLKIDRAQHARRHQRYVVRKPVRAKTAGRELQGEIKDISAGGAALLVDTHLENEQFVELHLEGLGVEDLGPLSAQVVRVYEKGFAVRFNLDDKEKERLAEELAKFRKTVARKRA